MTGPGTDHPEPPGGSVLSDDERRKVDGRDDDLFYSQPRFVVHVEDAFVTRLTELYDEVLPDGARVFDAMSAWTSHLPGTDFERVVGHGMNSEELAANDRLDEWFVQNLNERQRLPLETASFDAVLCAVSVQYLQYPAAVFAEFGRVLAPEGVLVVSFSNRMFPTKAVRAWRTATMTGRAALVEEYVDVAGGFEPPERVTDRPDTDPFYAVLAHRRPAQD